MENQKLKFSLASSLSLARSRFHHSNTLVYLTRLLRPPKCILGADCNWRWWGHLMTILCNRTRSNFLNCKTMENQKLKFSLARSLGHSPSLTRSLGHSPSLARSRFHHSNTLVYLTHLLRPPKCIWGADCNWRWWGHLMTILCNRTRSNFLNCKTMENQNLNFRSLARSLALVFTIQIHWCILLTCWDLPNVYGVLIAIGGGRDIWWLFYVIELVRTFWTVRRWKIKNLNFRSLATSLARYLARSLPRSLATSLTLPRSLALVFTIQIHWCILLTCWDLPNVYGVLIAIGGGRDIWWLFYVIELVRTFWTVRRWKIKNLNFRSLATSLPRSLPRSLSLALPRSLALVFTIQIHWCILLTCWDLPNVYWVLIAIGGGGDIWWLFYVIELVRTFWTVRRWKIKNLNFRSLASSLSLARSLARSLTERATWWNFHYLIFIWDVFPILNKDSVTRTYKDYFKKSIANLNNNQLMIRNS